MKVTYKLTPAGSQTQSLRLICAIGFLAFLSYDLIRSPLLPLFAESLGGSSSLIGVIVGASTLTGVLVKLPAGAISDTLGRPRFMLMGLLVFAIGPLGYLFVDNLWQLIFLRFFHGLATGIYAPVAMAVVVDLFKTQRAEALGWYTALTHAGRLLGRMAGGTLLLWFSFREVSFISFIVGLFSIVIFYRFMPSIATQDKQAIQKRATMRELLDGIKEVVKDASILTTSAMEALLLMASGTLMAFLPLYAISVGLNPAQVGLLFGMQGISSIGAKPLMGKLSDRIGRRPLIISGQVICAGVIFTFPWLESLWGLMLLSIIFGLGEAVIGSSTSALVADLCRSRSYGSAMGVFGTIMDIGHAGGPILSGALIMLLGYRGSFGIVSLALLIMTAIFIVVVKDSRPAFR